MSRGCSLNVYAGVVVAGKEDGQAGRGRPAHGHAAPEGWQRAIAWAQMQEVPPLWPAAATPMQIALAAWTDVIQ